eukprot:CAMPEP_0206228670 /NCGR_PEP_ID=MMETSP0047_2-20121206/9291_1 /ASSEMBLY_ACC=CAM_ASM_000192 /TAXON_ID=195065 /ORGANISM="Chroomonas mesostigmatica_cf, Strain CCMP1168" /LENGTH=148 /DNA_ID=CAMNT_0053651925 /DNA_START=34 /DNA_END=480 /DNA_ORIENTATION=+
MPTPTDLPALYDDCNDHEPPTHAHTQPPKHLTPPLTNASAGCWYGIVTCLCVRFGAPKIPNASQHASCFRKISSALWRRTGVHAPTAWARQAGRSLARLLLSEDIQRTGVHEPTAWARQAGRSLACLLLSEDVERLVQDGVHVLRDQL